MNQAIRVASSNDHEAGGQRGYWNDWELADRPSQEICPDVEIAYGWWPLDMSPKAQLLLMEKTQ